ncbi:MAG: two-component system, NtrC family, C4-dicarboxylate transport response regulator DctD [Sphingomonadales bacterium]|jgi:two-component system C4-dicarboxylate transport response regulator DctD|nr:two-component system, NtrC family, C4-dicarboxylate transport response regulator DctD [Sphingomonadales bacterium]
MFTALGTVFFVDDDATLREANVQSLELAGLDVVPFASGRELLERIDASFNGVVVSDIRMPEMDGLQIFETIRAIDPAIPVMLITGHGDVDMAVSALKKGAHDFLTKPFAVDHLIASVRRALEHRQLELDNRELRRLAAADSGSSALLGETPVMIRLRDTIAQVAATDVDVLLEGETGSGKELVARLLHRGSARRSRPFVAINCGAMPETMAESHLFGEENGGRQISIGRLEHANSGTLFLDEVDSMAPSLQARMLRVLEEREVLPLGAREARPLNIRVITASKRDLETMVAEGAFRGDLLYRMNMVRLLVPPLRERRADVPLLFAHFVEEAAGRMRKEPPPFSDATRRYLLEHDWPGNVRELRNFAFRSTLGLEESRREGAEAEPGETLPQRVERFEASVIQSVLADCRGDVQKALLQLGIPRKTFYDKLNRHGIDIRAYRS